MAVVAQMDFRGGTLDLYDQVIEKMGLQPGGPGPSGLLFHRVTKTDDGLRVVDVWESREACDRFTETQIAPITQEVGVPGPPDVQFFDVHNYLTAG